MRIWAFLLSCNDKLGVEFMFTDTAMEMYVDLILMPI